MHRREFLRCAAVCAGSMALGALPRAARAATKPNFLVIVSDDQAFDAYGAFGGEVHTPHIDRLARNGVSFTHAYNQGGWHGAICVASRTMLMTGRFLWDARALEPRLDDEVREGRLWPQLLSAAGYDTYGAGKWHVSTAADRVFDEVRHIRPGMPNQTPEGYHRPVDAADYEDGWKPWDTAHEGFWKGGTHWSEVLAEDAETFLDVASTRDNPFFMYLCFNAPHDPRQAPKEYVDRYPVDEVAVPGNFLPEYPHKEAIGAGKDLRDEQLAPFPRTEFAVRVHRQEYHAIISHMDTQIGRILDALERSGKAGDTVVIFTSDHGLAVGQHGFMGKQNMYDHSLRVPLILAGPGLPAGRRIDTPVYFQDIVPTTLEWAGADVPDAIDYRSLRPLLDDPDTPHYEAIYAAYMDLQRMVMRDGFKLIHYPAIDMTRLYHAAEDPLERHDLAGDPAHASIREGLETELQRLQRALGDPMAQNGEP